MERVCWSVSGLIQFYCSAAFVKQLKRVPSGLYCSIFLGMVEYQHTSLYAAEHSYILPFLSVADFLS